MAKKNYGKEFEQKFKEDMLKVGEISFQRLPDQFNGYKNSSNISDFIVYKYPNILYIELKCRYGNTFSIGDLTQYDKLVLESGKRGVYPIVIIWFIDHDKVVAFPIDSIKKMKEDGLKSVNALSYSDYPHIDIPSIKKRVFMDSDYNFLFNSLPQ